MVNSDSSLLDEFCDALWLEDGLTRNTLSSYRSDLVQFGGWLAESRSKALLEAQRGDVLDFLALKFRLRTKPRSAARLLSSLKRLYWS
jgi:integrase/recombinase XerD